MDALQVARKLRCFQQSLHQCIADSSVRRLDISGALVTVDPENAYPYYSVNRNRVQFLGCEHTVSSDAVDDIIDVFQKAEASRAFFSISPSPQDEEIRQWLIERGLKRFEGTGYPTLLRRAEAVKPARPSTLEIRHVNAEELCKQADRIQTLYPGPAMDASVFIGMLSQPGFHHVLAYAGDEAVAGSVLWVDGAFGYLGFGSTAEAYRNRGAQSEMIWRASIRRLPQAASGWRRKHSLCSKHRLATWKGMTSPLSMTKRFSFGQIKQLDEMMKADYSKIASEHIQMNPGDDWVLFDRMTMTVGHKRETKASTTGKYQGVDVSKEIK